MKYARRVLFAVIGFLAALFIFFPYNSAAKYAAAAIEANAAKNGIYITISDVETSGLFFKTCSAAHIKAELPLAVIECRDVQLSMSIFGLLSGSKSCKITTGRGTVMLPTHQKAEWNSGSASIKTDGVRLIADDIAFAGSTSLLGSAEFSVPDKNITQAHILIKNPAELDRAFNMASMAQLLPLKKVKDGEWRLEK